jgi:ElaB/YqjD/DUF883 family membrane-anchored ribosome-binding protein
MSTTAKETMEDKQLKQKAAKVAGKTVMFVKSNRWAIASVVGTVIGAVLYSAAQSRKYQQHEAR